MADKYYDGTNLHVGREEHLMNQSMPSKSQNGHAATNLPPTEVKSKTAKPVKNPSLFPISPCGTFLNELSIFLLENPRANAYDIHRWAHKSLKEASTSSTPLPLQTSERLGLLIDLFSMMPTGGDGHEAYRALAEGPRGRSAIIEDFTQPHNWKPLMALINDETIINSVVLARAWDVVYILRPQIPHGQKALAHMIEIDADISQWHNSQEEHWRRAAQIATRMKDDISLSKIEHKWLSVFETQDPTSEHATALISLGSLLSGIQHKIHATASKAEEIALRLEQIGTTHALHGSPHYQRCFLEGAISIRAKIRSSISPSNLQNEIGNSFLQEADQKIKNGDYISGTFILQQALGSFGKVPNKDRATLYTQAKIDQAKTLLETCQNNIHSQMHHFQSEPIDVSCTSQAVMDKMDGLNKIDGLVYLASQAKTMQYHAAKKDAEKLATQFPLRQIISKVRFNGHNQLISVDQQGMNKVYEPYDSDLFSAHEIHCMVACRSGIIPALEAFLNQNYMTLDELSVLLSNCPFVPPGHEHIIARGLHAGFKFDFLGAIHFLAPQMEAAIRHQFKIRGLVTTSFSAQQIASENGLSSLIQREEAVQILGKDLTFQIRALYADQMGPNFRNDLAHGLLTPHQASSDQSIFAWCSFLKLCLFGPPSSP